MITDQKYQNWKKAISKEAEAHKRNVITLKAAEDLMDDIVERFKNDQGKTLISCLNSIAAS